MAFGWREGLECLSHLTQEGDEVVVGALARHAEVAAFRFILDHVPHAVFLRSPHAHGCELSAPV